MEKSQKIMWTEGMFLTPHHFQQMDRYYETQLSDRIRAMTSLAWGIQAMEIDLDTLANGNLALLRFHGVFPDGMVVKMPEIDLLPEIRPIGQLFGPSLGYLDVFLGIPMERAGAPNTQLNDMKLPRSPRFKIDYIHVTDFNTGENVREIPVARKNLKIFFAGEETADYQKIKIAELVRTPAGNITLKENYIPPSLHLSSSPRLLKITRGLLEVLIGKSASLVGIQRGAAEGGGVDFSKLLLLQTVNAYIPILSYFSLEGKVHPEQLYLVLARLAGELTTFSLSGEIKDIPMYFHSDLSKTFTGLDVKIRNVIENVGPSRSTTIPLEIKRENFWTGTLQDEKINTSNHLYLAISGDLTDDTAKEMIPRRLKAGASTDLDLIISTALPGVRLYYTARPPATLPVKRDCHYFRIENAGDYWNSIIRSKTISFYVPADLKGLKLELMAAKE